MRLFVYTVFIGLVLNGCSEPAVSIQERYTNDRAEAALSSMKASSDAGEAQTILNAQDFFTRLKSSSSSDFSWTRWWNFLSSHDFQLRREDQASWNALFALKQLSCSNESDFLAFVGYLKSLRTKKIFLPPESPMEQAIDCFKSQSDTVRVAILRSESKEEFKSWALVEQAMMLTPPSRLEMESFEIWNSFVVAFKQQVTATQGEPPLAATRAIERMIKEQLLTSQSRKDLESSLQASAVNSSRGGLNRLRVEALRSAMDEAFNSDNLELWWKSYLKALQSRVNQPSLNEREIFNVLSLIGELILKSGQTSISKRGEIQSHLGSMISSLDDCLDSIYAALIQTPHLIERFETQVAASRSVQSHELWLLTLLNGGVSFRGKPRAIRLLETLDKMLHESSSPIEQWYAYRMILRHRFAQPLEEIISSDDPHPELKTWWSSLNLSPDANSKDVCPIPRMVAFEGMKFDRPFQNLPGNTTALDRGCFRATGAQLSNLSNATYDTLIMSPSAALSVPTASRALFDLSGETLPRFNIQPLPPQPGRALPLIYIENGENLSSRRWFVFHAIIQEPLPERLPDTVSGSITAMTPPTSASGGDFEIFQPNPLPIWVRTFAAPILAPLKVKERAEDARFLELDRALVEASILSYLREKRRDFSGIQPAYAMSDNAVLARLEIPTSDIMKDHFSPMPMESLGRIYQTSMPKVADGLEAKDSLELLFSKIPREGLQTKEKAFEIWAMSQLKNRLNTPVERSELNVFRAMFLPVSQTKILKEAPEPMGLGPLGRAGQAGRLNRTRYNIFHYGN